LQEDGFEGGGEFGLSGEFFGELSEDSRTVKVTASAIAGIAVQLRSGERFVGGEVVVNEGCEHLLIAQIGLDMLVGCGVRITWHRVKPHPSSGHSCMLLNG